MLSIHMNVVASHLHKGSTHIAASVIIEQVEGVESIGVDEASLGSQ